MIPIIPFLAWTGGVAAGAQVASGVARGVGKLVRGKPISAMVHVADGFVAPIRSACQELRRLGNDICGIVVERWEREQDPEPSKPAPARRQTIQRRTAQPTDAGTPSVNGAPTLVAKS